MAWPVTLEPEISGMVKAIAETLKGSKGVMYKVNMIAWKQRKKEMQLGKKGFSGLAKDRLGIQD